MSALDTVLPTPRLLELDHVDLAIPVARAWDLVRNADLGHHAPLIRALFAIRTIPGRITGAAPEPVRLRIGDLVSTPEKPGFQILIERPEREVVAGAIGKVWHLDIPFVHVESAADFEAFSAPDFAKVAWALRAIPLGEEESRIEIEVRVDATDEQTWRKFRRYFRIIGPGSRFIRHSLLAGLAREYGTPTVRENERPLAGDDLLPDASLQATQAIDIQAPPSAIWPWLVQMGGHRAGFYSIDLLDNDNVRSAREVHPDLSRLAVGNVIPATRTAEGGFEVLRIVPERELVLGGLFDTAAKEQLPFATPRPPAFWHVTWSFFLEPRDETTTRLHARARVCFSPEETFHATWIRPVHWLMQSTQLRELAARAEGRAPRDDWRDIGEGVGGAAIIAAAFLTPFLRKARRHWGVDLATANGAFPGDDLVPSPMWDWTHGVEIAASAEAVWPWVAQIGADRGGFYSYQWLENILGCNVRNAERVHPELALGPHDALSLHPRMPPLPIALYEPGKHLVVHAKVDATTRASGKPWVETSWGFFVEPITNERCRFISRFRCSTSADALAKVQFGPVFGEPIGFAMDRRMLLGVKERVEEARRARLELHGVT